MSFQLFDTIPNDWNSDKYTSLYSFMYEFNSFNSSRILLKELFVQLLEGEKSLPAAVTSYIDKYTATAQANATGLENAASQQ